LISFFRYSTELSWKNY